MSQDERNQLTSAYIREEVLVREAKARGLDQGDSVLRQHLAQKMATQLVSAPAKEPTDAELQQYLDAHSAEYRQAPTASFTQVFLDTAKRGERRGERVARRMLYLLNRAHATAADSSRYSDAFPHEYAYLQASSAKLTEHFGNQFVSALAQLPVDNVKWQGPLRSDLGWHLVLLSAQTTDTVPPLDAVRKQVSADLRRTRQRELQEQATRALIKQYQVQVQVQ
jgi:PPIC-type PPIASE domain